jgi:hypothetical protein
MIPAFAANPTPYNEWDFDFTSVQITQDSKNLNKMIISMNVTYHGEMQLGTVSIITKVTDPSSYTSEHTELLRDMKIDETRPLNIVHQMKKEGTYSIDLSMTPPSAPHLGHIFDSNVKTFTVKPMGLERTLETIVSDSKEKISYMIEKQSTVRYYEALHAVIDLPEIHSFEKITVENGIVTEYPTDTTDIYIDSVLGYLDIKVNLVRQGNLLTSADAQDAFKDYVKFYAISDDVCYSVDCVTVYDVTNDATEKPEEFPWMLVIIPVKISVGVAAYFKNKSKPQSPVGKQ